MYNFNMKSFILLSFLLVAGTNADIVHLSGAQKERANQIITECVKSTGISPEVLAEAKQGKLSEDEGLKKFIFCFFLISGILSEDAKLNIDVALAKLPPGVDKVDAKKLLESCKSKSGKDTVDTAFEMFKCYTYGIKTHVLI